MSTPKMETTRHPGIYRRGSRYVVVWRHKGRQHKSVHRTLAEAREAQGQRRQTAERAPVSRQSFEDYAREWLTAYQGRTARGFTARSRDAYRRTLEQLAIPFFAGHPARGDRAGRAPVRRAPRGPRARASERH